MSKVKTINKITIFILLINSININGQSDQHLLLNAFDAYSSHIEQKEYEEAFDYYLDSFLLYIPKAQLIKQLADIADSEKIEFELNVSPLEYISDSVVGVFGKQYYFINYTNSFVYVFKAIADEVYKLRVVNTYQKSNESTFIYAEAENKFSFSKSREMIAIIDDGQCHFIVFKEKLKPYMHLWMAQQTFDTLLLKRYGANIVETE